MIFIAGAGLTGLSCALELLQANRKVTLFETRQEIGNPIRSPGLLRNMNPKYIEPCCAILGPLGWGLRREWLEKEIAREVLEMGGKINLRSRAPKGAIDCTGGKSPAPGWPVGERDNLLTSWSGGITIEDNLPDMFSIDVQTENNLCFQRGDGLVECWSRSESLPRPNQGWLEVMKGEHPPASEEISGDDAIARGKTIARKFIQSEPGVTNHDTR